MLWAVVDGPSRPAVGSPTGQDLPVSPRSRLAVVVRLAPVGMEQVNLEVCESSVAVTAARKGSVVLATGRYIARFETGIQFADFGHYDQGIVKRDALNFGAYWGMEVVVTCGSQRIPDSRGIEAWSWAEVVLLLQPQDERAAAIIAERAQGVPHRLRQAASGCFYLMSVRSVPAWRSSATRRANSGPPTTTSGLHKSFA